MPRQSTVVPRNQASQVRGVGSWQISIYIPWWGSRKIGNMPTAIPGPTAAAGETLSAGATFPIANINIHNHHNLLLLLTYILSKHQTKLVTIQIKDIVQLDF